jgi:hypothetical protein
MRGALPSLPLYTVKAWCSVKRKPRDNFTFYIYHYIFFLVDEIHDRSSRILCGSCILDCVSVIARVCMRIASLIISSI